MRKLLALLLVFAFASGASAIVEFDNAADSLMPTLKVDRPYLMVYQIMAGDTCDIGQTDTTWHLPFFPKQNGPAPDEISIFGYWTETATGADDGSLDTMLIDIDVCAISDSASLSKTSAIWAPLTLTAGDAVFANRTGKNDTLTGTTADAAGSFNYPFTSTMLSLCPAYFRIVYGWDDFNAADDTILVTMYATYKWKHDNTD
jgi:hypothetical protein